MALALSDQKNPAGLTLEHEQRDLLDTVVSDLWDAFVGKCPSSIARMQSSFGLLQHLAARQDVVLESARAA
jgi:hypothetical protein